MLNSDLPNFMRSQYSLNLSWRAIQPLFNELVVYGIGSTFNFNIKINFQLTYCKTMQTKQVFLVFDFTHDSDIKPQIYGVFDNMESALSYAKKLKEKENQNANPEVMPIHIKIGKEENECQSFDFRKHIAFDMSKMELPIKCDVCTEHATHFCFTHRGVYCINHIIDHEDNVLDFYKKDSTKLAITDSDGKRHQGVLFSEEDVELVCQQAGVDREKAIKSLVEANGDLARAILLLKTK